MKDDAFLDIIKKVEGYDKDFEVGRGYIDTGCYILNALTSGSIFGGIANNRITGFAGDPATGKCAVGYEGIEVWVEEKDYDELMKKINL